MTKTADFLVELGTEELPPKALRRLRDAFAVSLATGLDAQRLAHGDIQAFASPRRLALVVADLASCQERREVKQKGPPVKVAFDGDGNPTKAALAFAKKCGVPIDNIQREKTDAGEWLVHIAAEEGRYAAELLPDVIQTALNELPIPRRMRWGSGDSEFVRPVHWLVMLHGKSIVEGNVMGLSAGDTTRGHRFHAPGEIKVSSPKEYGDVLREVGKVLAEFDARRARIVAGVRQAAAEAGGSPVGSDDLYDEVTALTEWPVPLTGTFDTTFLALPDEVIVETLTSHQRYFPVRDNDDKLLPAFVTVANLESTEPDRVRDGNERVIHPRLADAAFFWESDLQTPLSDKRQRLSKVVYQQGLGSLQDKSDRIGALAEFIADEAGADKAQVQRAAELCKCDLVTGMVGEFPELQGIMGGYYAAHAGEDPKICAAIGEHYMPRFAGDDLPASSTGQVLAMADKLDTIAGAFALGKKPSGNRDPFGLRRAALGVIRLILEESIDVDLKKILDRSISIQPINAEDDARVQNEIYEFFIDRYRSYAEAHPEFAEVVAINKFADVFEAVRARRPTSLLDFQGRMSASIRLGEFSDSATLSAATKRAGNILKKANFSGGEISVDLFVEDAERELYNALTITKESIAPLMSNRNYIDTYAHLVKLAPQISDFFDNVMVMADDKAQKNNRLSLVSEFHSLMTSIADISRLAAAQD